MHGRAQREIAHAPPACAACLSGDGAALATSFANRHRRARPQLHLLARGAELDAERAAVAFGRIRLEGGHVIGRGLAQQPRDRGLRAGGQAHELRAGDAGEALDSRVLVRRAVHHPFGEVEEVEVGARGRRDLVPMFSKSSGLTGQTSLLAAAICASVESDALRHVDGLLSGGAMPAGEDDDRRRRPAGHGRASTRRRQHARRAALRVGLGFTRAAAAGDAVDRESDCA